MAHALALIALRTYWQLAGLGSVALAPLALCLSALAFGAYCICGLTGSCSGEYRLLLLSGLIGSEWLSLLSGLSGSIEWLLLLLWTHWLIVITAFGTYCLVGLTGSLLVELVLASGSVAQALTFV